MVAWLCSFWAFGKVLYHVETAWWSKLLTLCQPGSKDSGRGVTESPISPWRTCSYMTRRLLSRSYFLKGQRYQCKWCDRVARVNGDELMGKFSLGSLCIDSIILKKSLNLGPCFHHL
jgi:hypothetical protein